MENCLITKLNGIVDNSNLDKLNETTLACAAITGYYGIVADSANTVKLVLDGGTVNGATEVYAPTSGTLHIVPNAGVSIVKINASPKYNLVKLASAWPIKGLSALAYNNIESISLSGARTNEAFWNVIGDINISELSLLKNKVLESLSIDGSSTPTILRHFKGNIEDLKRFNSLSVININLSEITGDIVNLRNLTSLTTLVINFSSVYGNIANLGSLKSLTRLGFRTNTTNKVQGTIENFVKAQVSGANGRTSGEITIVGNLGAVTFNNAALPNDITERTLSWVPKAGNKTTITFNGVEVDIDS